MLQRPSHARRRRFIGQVTAIALPTIVVEEKPTEPHGSAKAGVRITEGTQVLRQGEGVGGFKTCGGQAVEQRLQRLLLQNPLRTDFQQHY